MENVIEIKNLTKYYGSFFWKKPVPALHDLTLDIPIGAVFGFLGPNGAGKTTTIKLLMDLIKPSGGEASILGYPPDNVEIKKQIGFLPDEPVFSSYLSANEFLDICARLLGVPSRERKGRIAEVLSIVKMTKHAKAKLGGFSRGMVQRIGIAQAILNRPRLLILDEPLVGLDPHGRQELKDIILHQKAGGTSVFFCSHILSDVEKICDSLGILYEGNLLCAGNLDELLQDTGVRLHIKPEHDKIAKTLLSEASETVKLPDGGWELTFLNNKEVKQTLLGIKEQYKDAVIMIPAKENLEKFFFRKIADATRTN
ncbi:MAG: ABC transporter ATP-binding protein [Victivallaceae bacterium]|nr:ABC transporter ATP-binding protein [Victivallaceae bacterium]